MSWARAFNGHLADHDNVPAVDDIATGIVDSVGILVAAAQESPRGERPSVLTQMTSHTQKRSHARH